RGGADHAAAARQHARGHRRGHRVADLRRFDHDRRVVAARWRHAPGSPADLGGPTLTIPSARQLLSHLDENSYWPAGCGLTLAQAYDRALAVRQLRIARGEQPRGFKVGFTNRGIWPRYNVYRPIWGTVWDTTLSFCDGRGAVSLDGCSEPRIEPETVF